MVGSKNCNDHRNHGGDLVEVEFNAVHVRFTPRNRKSIECIQTSVKRQKRTLPHQCALHTARQNKFDIRRHTERRRRSGSSVAVSQAGVKDLIAAKYSHC